MDQLRNRRTQIIIGIAAVIVLALLIWLILWLSFNGLWPVARDIALVVLAVITMVPLLALAYAVLELARTAQAIKRELVPLIAELRETTHTVADTAKVASDFTVKPAVRTASFLVGFRQATSIILGRGHTRRSAERRRRTRDEAEALRMEADGAANGNGSAPNLAASHPAMPPAAPIPAGGNDDDLG